MYQVAWCVPPWGWSEFRVTVALLLTFSVRNGSNPERCSEEIKRSLGRRFAVPVRRGSDAILVALRALHVQPTDEVILPSYVCISVLDAVHRSGARPVFADIDSSLHMSVKTIESAITPRTKCAIVPHLFGNTAPLDEIEPMLRRRNIILIDDAAQGFGSQRAGRAVGSFGDFGIVCGGPGKPLAAASGGLLLMDDEALFAEAMRQEMPIETTTTVLWRLLKFWVLRRFRRYTILLQLVLDRRTVALVQLEPYAYGLSNLDAAILCELYRKLAAISRCRKRNALLLLQILRGLPWKVITEFREATVPVKLVILLPEEGPNLATVIRGMAAAGIECQGGYEPCHHFAHTSLVGGLDVTESLWRRVLCIPIDQPLRDTQPLARLVASWIDETVALTT